MTPREEVEKLIGRAEAYKEMPDASSKTDTETAWAPPPVTTYGASFDPAAIPLRQWLILGRHARGEGCAIVGPPGTNKSSLLLMDAVQIATGRNLIGDRVDETGAVLFMVGEDGRRDFEARLAGVLAHYHLAPADLT